MSFYSYKNKNVKKTTGKLKNYTQNIFKKIANTKL